MAQGYDASLLRRNYDERRHLVGCHVRSTTTTITSHNLHLLTTVLPFDGYGDGSVYYRKKARARELEGYLSQSLTVARDLRKGARLANLAKELIAAFPRTGRNTNYDYLEGNVPKSFKNIQWVEDTKTVQGHSWKEINFPKTESENPDMSNQILQQRVEKRKEQFRKDKKDNLIF